MRHAGFAIWLALSLLILFITVAPIVQESFDTPSAVWHLLVAADFVGGFAACLLLLLISARVLRRWGFVARYVPGIDHLESHHVAV